MERDGFYGGAAVAAVRRLPCHVGARRESFEVHAHERIYCVDQADGVGAAAFGCERDVGDVCDVGREFRDDRSFRNFFGPRRNHFGVFGHLADGGAHAALAHAVRAAEIQFERIGAGIFRAANDLVPGFAFGFDH